MNELYELTNPVFNTAKMTLTLLSAVGNEDSIAFEKALGFEQMPHVDAKGKEYELLKRIGAITIELRNPDSAANPYLALAVCMAAGLDGIRNEILPPDSVDANIFAMSEEERAKQGIECLPGNLLEAVQALEQDKYIYEVLGEHTAERFIREKKKEWEEYRASVSQWEIDRYLSKI